MGEFVPKLKVLSFIVFASVFLNFSNTWARPTVGAIRWDYWFSGSPYTPLITPEWDSRRPFFGNRNPNGTISMQGDQQSVVDQEILAASGAGLDYFNFLSYLGYDNDGLSFAANRGLGHFLKSQHKSKMKFALTISAYHVGLSKTENNNQAWQNTRNIIVSLVSKPEYLKQNGRPLIYFMDADIFDGYWGSTEEAAQKINLLKQDIQRATGAQPLLVAMVWTSYHWGLLVNKLPNLFDGVTSYSNAPTFDNTDANGKDWGTANVELAYADLQKGCVGRDRKFRNSFQSDIAVVPTITTGWDERPLKGTDPYYQRGLNNSWCAHATPDEIANHVGETLGWVSGRAKTLDTVLMYAWNEYLEGGFIAPMAGEGDARLKALGKVLNATITPPPPSGSVRVLKKEFNQYSPVATLSVTNDCSVAGDYPNTCRADLNISGVDFGTIALTVGTAQGEVLAACYSASGGKYSAPWINYDLRTQFKTYKVSSCAQSAIASGVVLSQLTLSFEFSSNPVNPVTPVLPASPILSVEKNHFSGSSTITLVGNKCSEPGDYAETCTANFQISREPQAATIIFTVESSANGNEVMATCFNAAAGGVYRAPWVNYNYKTRFRSYYSSNCSASDINASKLIEQIDLSFTK